MAGEPAPRNGSNSSPRSDGDAEKNGGKGQDSPAPVGFWDPSLKATRKFAVLGWLKMTLILMVFILTVLSLYWAVLFHIPENMSALTVGVVDFDAQLPPYTDTEPMIGPMVTQFAERSAHTTSPHLGYVVQPPSRYNNDPMAVRQAVYDEHLWAAIIVNANATALLQEAVTTGNRSYDPLGATQLIYNQARDQSTYDEYIIPMLQEALLEMTSAFGERWAGQLLSNETYNRTILSQVPQAVSPAIGTSIFNLRPFGPPQATPAVTIGLIYLIIIAFFSFNFYLPIHSKYITPEGHPPMHFYQLIIWRWFSAVTAYFFLSLAYSLVSLAFQIPFSRPSAPDTEVATNPSAYHHGSFVVYWAINFLGMIALGLPSENFTMVFQKITPLWLIFWVISNVSTSFYEIKLEPRFFYWGYAWPLHNIVQATRTILFDTHSKIGLNVGVLIAWAAVSTAIFPVACVIFRRKHLKEQGQNPTLREILR